MDRPSQDAIDMFMSITGASEADAAQTLQVYSGDLNSAVNSYFSEGDRRTPANEHDTSVAAQVDFMDIDDPVEVDSQRLPSSLLSQARVIMDPFSNLDSTIPGRLFDINADFTSRSPFTPPREVREIPVEVKDDNLPSSQSGLAPRIEDATGTSDAYISDVKETVVSVEDDHTSVDPTIQATSHGEQSGGSSRERVVRPSAPEIDQYPDYGNDIEEEMIRAAIEASRREAEQGFSSQPFGAQNDSMDAGPHQQDPYFEDPELAHVVSLSLKTAEQEKAIREKGANVEELKEGACSSNEVEMKKIGSINESSEAGHASICNEDEELEEKPLLRHESRGSSSGTNGSAKVGISTISPPSSPREQNTGNSSQNNGNAFPSDEWGGISSEEHDEAVMLEAAMFGGIPEGRGYHFPRAPHQYIRNGDSYLQPFPRAPSPSLLAQRIIREQQDDEYLAALQADREKEVKAMEEAETRRQEERQKEEEIRLKLEQQQELERQLAAKEASLPDEPSVDDENAVTLLVRMPEGSRRGRRFLKHDRLQCLFDFIDITKVVKPGSYRLVRPYPRRVFGEGETALTLSELGLTSKQEALFLELI